MERVLNLPSLNGSGKLDRIAIYSDIESFTARADKASRQHPLARADSWNGATAYDETLRLCSAGDLSRVAASDAYLEALESRFQFQSSAYRTIDAMAGGVPNVPAMLAGQPLHMRQRRRMVRDLAPLNVVCDVTSSGGIDSETLERRGAALLALVRILSAVRPLSLYVCVNGHPSAFRNSLTSSAVAFRIETAPLDLARAGHLLCHTGISRQIGYTVMCENAGQTKSGGIHWPYDSESFSRQRGAEYWQRAIGQDEMLFLAPVYLTDKMVSDPVEWISDMLTKFGGDTYSAAA